MADKAHQRLYQLEVDHNGRGWQITFDWGEFDGRHEVIGCHITSCPDGQGEPQMPITAEVIRKLPLGTIIRAPKRHHEQNELRAAEQHGGSRDDTAKWGPKRGQALPRRPARGGGRIQPRLAVVHAGHRGCSDGVQCGPEHGRQRIMAARKAGLIPPKGRARSSARGSVKKDESGRWYFVVDLASGAKRRQVRRRGFRTKEEGPGGPRGAPPRR